MYDRLDLHQRAENRGRLRDASSPVEMVQVIHRHIMGDVQLILLDPLLDLIDRLSFFFELKRLVQKKALPQAGAERIENDDLCLLLFF